MILGTGPHVTQPLDDIILEGGLPPLIPDGDYEAVYTHHETVLVRAHGGTPRAYVWVRIIEEGPYHGVEIYRAYRVARLTSKPGRRGGIAVRRRHELFLMLARLLGTRARPDRISIPGVLRGV